jgi:hypothetical protein
MECIQYLFQFNSGSAITPAAAALKIQRSTGKIKCSEQKLNASLTALVNENMQSYINISNTVTEAICHFQMHANASTCLSRFWQPVM